MQSGEALDESLRMRVNWCIFFFDRYPGISQNVILYGFQNICV